MFLLCRCLQAFYTCALGFTFELQHCVHKAFRLLAFCLHRHHLTLGFLFFIFVVGCDYTLVFIKLRSQSLGFFVLFPLCCCLHQTFLTFWCSCRFVIRFHCNVFSSSSPWCSACVWVFISISIMLRWEFPGMCLDYVICAQQILLLFMLLCLHFVVCLCYFVHVLHFIDLQLFFAFFLHFVDALC